MEALLFWGKFEILVIFYVRTLNVIFYLFLTFLTFPKGDTPACKDILHATIVPPIGTITNMCNFDTQFTRPTYISSMIPLPTSLLMMILNSDEKMREIISAGSLGLTFSLITACARCPVLTSIETRMSSIPYATGFPPSRWRKAVNMMLLKVSRFTRVDKLCTILLSEADYDFNKKKLGRNIMVIREENCLLAQEQSGRKVVTAIEHSLNKRITYDVMRQLRMTS